MAPNTKAMNNATTVAAEVCDGLSATRPFFATESVTAVFLLLISYPIINPDKTQPQRAKPI